MFNKRVVGVWVWLLLVCMGACTPAAPAETATPSAGPPTETPTKEGPVAPENPPTPTLTPTPALGGILTPTPTAEPASGCAGMAAQLEIQILAGPAEAVGLEPYAIGAVPISASAAGPPYPVTGGGGITYADVYQADWGTYTVEMDLNFTVSGTCTGPAGQEQLNLLVTMAGSQLITVDAQEFQGEYPWSGTQELAVTLPLTDGASAAGEGWGIVLGRE